MARTPDRGEIHFSGMDSKPCGKGSCRMPFIESYNRRRYFERGAKRIHTSLRHAGVGLPSAQSSVARDVGNHSIVPANRGEKRPEVVLHQIVQRFEGKVFSDGRETLDIGSNTDCEM